MRGRFSAISVVAALGLVACPRTEAGAPDRPVGRLVLERTAPVPRRLLDTRARARYCLRDSTMTIVGIDDRWSAALALRTPWPPLRQFTVDSALGAVGTAAVAARPLGDSAGGALIGRHGTILLDSGTAFSGHFTVATGGDSGGVTLSGRFVDVRADTSGCATP